MTVGLISDTHDLLRPQALDALRGVDLILHAGDVCSPGILDELRTVAPLRAVRGNCDYGAWSRELPVSDTWELGGHLVHAVHDLGTLDIDPRAAGVSMVLYGHSHRPAIEDRNGVLFVNPGSAGPVRFSLPVTLARMTFDEDGPRIESVTLI